MDIRAMRYFVAIIDHGSLTRAAEVVCVAQPALSQQLAALEEEFGVPLVHRGAKGVRPTEAGKTLYRHIRNILRQVEMAGADVRVAGSEISGNVAIGLPTTAAAAFGMPLVLPSGSQGLREVVERSFAKAGIALNVVADLDSLPFLLAAAREGLACTVLPASSLGEGPEAEGNGDAGSSIGRRLILPELRRTLSLCWPRALPRSNAAEAVAEILREIVAARIAQGGSLAPPPSPPPTPAAPAGR